jgi:DNA repair exonuclease SbcCD nuclease subunit
MKTQDLLKKSNLIMSGHFHLRDERKYDNGTIIYVGNPFEMDFGDTGSTKGIYFLDIEKMTYDFVENNLSPKHKKISLTELTNTKNITSSDINQMINGNFVKFVVDKKANSEIIDTLIQKFSGYRPLSFITDYTYTENSYNIDDKNYDTTGVNMEATIEEFVRVLDIENKESIIRYCSDLYKRASEI